MLKLLTWHRVITCVKWLSNTNFLKTSLQQIHSIDVPVCKYLLLWKEFRKKNDCHFYINTSWLFFFHTMCERSISKNLSVNILNYFYLILSRLSYFLLHFNYISDPCSICLLHCLKNNRNLSITNIIIYIELSLLSKGKMYLKATSCRARAYSANNICKYFKELMWVFFFINIF